MSFGTPSVRNRMMSWQLEVSSPVREPTKMREQSALTKQLIGQAQRSIEIRSSIPHQPCEPAECQLFVLVGRSDKRWLPRARAVGKANNGKIVVKRQRVDDSIDGARGQLIALSGLHGACLLLQVRQRA